LLLPRTMRARDITRVSLGLPQRLHRAFVSSTADKLRQKMLTLRLQSKQRYS